MNRSTRPLKFEILLLCAVAALGIAGGVLWNAALPFLLAGVSAYAGWHLYHLLRLSHLILHSEPLPKEFPPGMWSVIYRNAYTLKRRNRKRKRRVSRFLKRFTESASAFPDAAVIIGNHGDVEWCNPAAGGLLGVMWPRDARRKLTDLIPDPLFREYLEGGPGADKPFEFPSPADQTKILSLYTAPFGKKRQRLLVARDITRAYLVDRTRRDFIANASHELRTPLTVIRGFLEAWGTGETLSGQHLRQAELMLEQAKRMEGTISDMLTLSRLEYEDKPGRTGSVDIAAMMTSIVAEAKALSGRQGHVFDLVIGDPRHLLGDAVELRAAFSNLVFNAVRHTPRRTRIEVSWTVGPDGARLRVSDNGEGIPARHIPRLTERFYRPDPSRSRKSGGTGLGLAIVKHVLTRHDAELQISSRAGQGSTFTCLFPGDRVVEAAGANTATRS